MNTADKYAYGKTGMRRFALIVVPLVLVVGLSFALVRLTGDADSHEGATLDVYVAAGIRPPVEKIAAMYEQEYGVEITLISNNSGGLLSTIATHPRGDLYIPADAFFTALAREKKLVREAVPLAVFRLVVAVKPGNPKNIRSLDDLLAENVNYVVCNVEAGAGKKTIEFMEKAGRWNQIKAGAKLFTPTVNDATGSIHVSNTIDAGFVWDSTAKQYGLEIVPIPELAGAAAEIHAGILTACRQPAAALRFARYLVAPEKGGTIFVEFEYEPVRGDVWTETPVLNVYCGGVNRKAVELTLREFEKREGCRINQSFAGCGMLVAQIHSTPLTRDMFLTCESSYMTTVQDLFLEASDVSETAVVLLVRKNSDKDIRKLEDLAAEGVSVGITRPEASALGALSVKLLKKAGLWDRVEPNVKVRSPTAHELVLQVEAHDKLDVALVYEANCQQLKPELTFHRLDHPAARAVQNIAAGRDSKYPHMAQRLIDAIKSADSKKRFQSNGFKWLAGRAEP